MIGRLLAACAAAAAIAPALAADFTPTTTVGAALSGESLSAGKGSWSEKSLSARRNFAKRTLAEMVVSSVRRYGVQDAQVAAAGAFPLGASVTASVDASYSTTHRILPRHAAGAALQWEFAKAWLLHGGARTVRYDSVHVKQGQLGVEHYVGDYSASLTWRPTRALGVNAYGVAFAGNWYYGDKDAVGLTLASGREASSLPEGVLLGRVSSAAIVGRHRLTPSWSVNYSLSRTRQAELHTRNGASIGLAYTY